jgi:hypothetical protein
MIVEIKSTVIVIQMIIIMTTVLKIKTSKMTEVIIEKMKKESALINAVS